MATTKSFFSLLTVLLFSLIAATSARPCKTLFFITTTTTSYSFPRNPNSNNLNNFPQFQNPNPRYFTLIFTSTTNRRFDSLPSASSFPAVDRQSSTSSDYLPLKFYKSSGVSTSIRDRTKDIMSVVGALLFGVGCGALTAATMYFIWSLFTLSRCDYDYDNVSYSSSSDDDDDDDVAAYKKRMQLGYVSIPTKVVDVEEVVVVKEEDDVPVVAKEVVV